MAFDPSTSVGQVRLRIGDISDLPILSDEIINNEIVAASNNLPSAARTCAQYILATLAFKTHKKMVQLEIWGQESYKNYKDFLVTVVTNPAFMSYTPIPYSTTSDSTTPNPLAQFVDDWNNNWQNTTVTQNMELTAWPNLNRAKA